MKNKTVKQWYVFTNKAADNTTDIDIFDKIGSGFFDEGVTAKSFISKLRKVKTEKINVRINSNGGDVFQGLSIFNALKEHESHVTVTILGIAASIASVIAMAGEKVKICKSAIIMIHDPRGKAVGTAEDMNKIAEALTKIKGSLISVYQDKTCMENDTLSDLMSAETWLTAEEAVDFGFADEIIAPDRIEPDINNMVNRIDGCGYKNVPKRFLNAGLTGKRQLKEKDMTLDELKAKSPDLYNAVFEAGKVEGEKAGLEKGKVEVQGELQASAANSEMNRIKSVEAQFINGHEELIKSLKWDGKTTGEQAAVAVLQAEKGLRASMLTDLNDDAVDAVDADILDDAGSLPDGEERWTAEYSKSADLQNEFKGLSIFLAYKKGVSEGRVKMFRRAK